MRTKALAALAASLLTLSVALPAQAAVTIDSSNIGSAIIVDYNAFNTPDGIGGTLPGLTAQGIFTLTAITGSQFRFSYAIANTSGGATAASRVAVFGFTTSPSVSSVTLFTPPGSVFTNIGINSNVPNLTGTDAGRVCFRAAGGGSQCGGGGGGGVGIGDPAATGNFVLGFAPGTTSFNLDRFFVRYQSLESDAYQAESATGVGVVGGAVPEPATWMMMMLGFGLIGGAMRRRQKVRVTYA